MTKLKIRFPRLLVIAPAVAMALFTVTPSALALSHAAKVATICGTIGADTTWSPSSASTYVVDCATTISKNVTLTVAPGTVIKFSAGSGVPLTVEGSLVAVGTSADPITFTSINDNTVGGATGTGAPAPGDWYGAIIFGSLNLQYADVDYATVGIQGNASQAAKIEHDSFSSESDGAVAFEGPDVLLENNSAVNGQEDTGSGAAVFEVNSTALNLGDLTGNTATGQGLNGVEVGGTAVTSKWAAGKLPLLIDPCDCSAGGIYGNLGTSLDIPSGATVTLAAGTVVKSAGTPGGAGVPLTVEGSLVAVGTSADPITFTSINDNTVGGATGTGAPAPGDWYGIQATGNTKIVHAKIAYASTGVDLEASPGVNDAIHYDWFDENETALGGSSDWEPVDIGIESCQYVPQISSTSNTYGPSQLATPFVSAADHAAIKAAIAGGAESSPDGWTDHIAIGTSDTVTWALLPCEADGATTYYVATPYGFFTG